MVLEISTKNVRKLIFVTKCGILENKRVENLKFGIRISEMGLRFEGGFGKYAITSTKSTKLYQ